MNGKLKVLDFTSIPMETYNKVWEGIFDHSRFELIRADPEASEDRICELVKDVDILLLNSVRLTPVTERVIEAGGS